MIVNIVKESALRLVFSCEETDFNEIELIKNDFNSDELEIVNSFVDSQKGTISEYINAEQMDVEINLPNEKERVNCTCDYVNMPTDKKLIIDNFIKLLHTKIK